MSDFTAIINIAFLLFAFGWLLRCALDNKRAQDERDRLAAEVQRITEARRVEWANAQQVQAELCACIEDLALSLECEVNARYAETRDHPAIKPKYDGDMQEVIDARALLAKVVRP